MNFNLILLYLSVFISLTVQSSEVDTNNKKIIGIELLIASPSNNDLASGFGHAMLRLVDDDINDFNDIVINFGAEIKLNDKGLKYIISGLSGEYPLEISMRSMELTLRKYIIIDGRQLKRYIIPIDDNDLNKLINKLVWYNKSSIHKGNYYFLTRNCATILSELLSVILSNKNTNFPENINLELHRSFASPFPEIQTRSYRNLIEKLSAQKTLTTDLIDNFSYYEKRIILEHIPQMSDKNFNYIIKSISSLKKIDLASVYNIKKLEKIFYKLCINKGCAENIIEKEKRVWTRDLLKSKRNWRRTLYYGNRYKKYNKRLHQIKLFVESQNDDTL